MSAMLLRSAAISDSRAPPARRAPHFPPPIPRIAAPSSLRNYQLRPMNLEPGCNIQQQPVGLDDAMFRRRIVDILTRVIRQIALASQRVDHRDPGRRKADG